MTPEMTNSAARHPDELAGVARQRSGLYRLLAAVFREELTAESLHGMLQPEFLHSLAQVGVDIEGLSSLSADEALLSELSLEFTRLFLGPGPHVSPYESVHLGGEGGSLWGPETQAVKRFIQHSGFCYDERYHGLPDHIGVELEFMAGLTGMEADAWDLDDSEAAFTCLRREKTFLSRHLGRWAGRFANKVGELATMPLYPQMAALTRDYVAADNRELDGIGELDGPSH